MRVASNDTSQPTLGTHATPALRPCQSVNRRFCSDEPDLPSKELLDFVVEHCTTMQQELPEQRRQHWVLESRVAQLKKKLSSVQTIG